MAKTLDTFRPELGDKYRISNHEVRDAIGWAAINIAIENYMAASDFSDDQRRDLQIHIHYLIRGAIGFAEYNKEGESDE